MPRALTARQCVWLRIAAALALSASTSAFLTLDTLRQASAGSNTAFLLATPVLGALIATGIRPSPGVGDSEFDWIIAVIFAAGSLLALELLSRRLPTLAGLWHWDHYASVIWAMSIGMVLFTARHVLRLWRLWVFALCAAPAIPYLLLTAQLGGTEDSAVLAAAGLGTVAVYLATSTLGTARRLAAATINLGGAIGASHLLGMQDTWTRPVVVAGLVPVVTVVVVRRAAHRHVAGSLAAHPAKGSLRFPDVGLRSYGVLALIGAALLVLSPQVAAVQPALYADSGWIKEMGLARTADFTFIGRFIGPGTTLTRYAMPPSNADPAVAVDVITAPNLARLNDYTDAVWYPSPTPVNYRPVELGGPAGVEARSAQSDPDAAEADSAGQWYALSWLWQTEHAYERITVVVNQDLNSGTPPSPPQPLTWTNALLEPALWLTRQQPAPIGAVAKRVSRTGALVAERILQAGTSR